MHNRKSASAAQPTNPGGSCSLFWKQKKKQKGKKKDLFFFSSINSFAAGRRPKERNCIDYIICWRWFFCAVLPKWFSAVPKVPTVAPVRVATCAIRAWWPALTCCWARVTRSSPCQQPLRRQPLRPLCRSISRPQSPVPCLPSRRRPTRRQEWWNCRENRARPADTCPTTGCEQTWPPRSAPSTTTRRPRSDNTIIQRVWWEPRCNRVNMISKCQHDLCMRPHQGGWGWVIVVTTAVALSIGHGVQLAVAALLPGQILPLNASSIRHSHTWPVLSLHSRGTFTSD